MITYNFNEGIFTFHTAYFGSWANDVRVVFRVRNDNNPKQRAKEKRIRFYDRILPSTNNEVKLWMEAHPNHLLEDKMTKEELIKLGKQILAKMNRDIKQGKINNYVYHVIILTTQVIIYIDKYSIIFPLDNAKIINTDTWEELK